LKGKTIIPVIKKKSTFSLWKKTGRRAQAAIHLILTEAVAACIKLIGDYGIPVFYRDKTVPGKGGG
jgi:hypothetical protein